MDNYVDTFIEILMHFDLSKEEAITIAGFLPRYDMAMELIEYLEAGRNITHQDILNKTAQILKEKRYEALIKKD